MEALIVTFLVYLCTVQAKASTSDSEYLNLWVAEIHGGEEVAQRVARDTGFTYNGPAGPFEDHYELTRDDHPDVSTLHSHHLTRSLMDIDEVKWSEQQRVVTRSWRANIPERFKKELNEHGTEGLIRKTVKETQQLVPRDPKRKVGSFMTIPSSTFSTLPSEEGTLSKYRGPTRRGFTFYDSYRSPYEYVFHDPYWRSQWYLHDYRTWNGPVYDHNVVPVYKSGITGEGVTVMVVDNGVVNDHPDLKQNFLEDFSYNFCERKPGCEPSSSLFGSIDHGTKCAGVIAMEADNEYCGVGIAYNAKISGVRTLCPNTSEYRESRGLAHKQSEVSIYSSSWGPTDDGSTMERPGRMTVKSINMGLQKGRGGKGSLYVFAAGNGRENEDNCSADGLVNLIGTIGITSANTHGTPTYYGERCSAVYATTYSGDRTGPAITATTLYEGCLSSFSGTSASTPIAAGIFALLLEAKPTLSYRDVMHLIAMTAEVAPLADNADTWYKNGRGFWVSNDFGFGLLNAENMVRMAKDWEPVPEKKSCVITMKPKKPFRFRTSEYLNITIDTEACMKKSDSNVLYIEQIELTSTIEYPYRGALSIYVTSPQETRTLVLEPRPRDRDRSGLYEWTVKSVHNWGEHPRGKWIISVLPVSMTGYKDKEAVARRFVLTIHGTSDKPAHYIQPRVYSAFRLPDGTTPWPWAGLETTQEASLSAFTPSPE